MENKNDSISQFKNFIAKRLIKKQSKTTRRIVAFKLGYRWSFLSTKDKATLGRLMKEILEHTHDKLLIKAFREGEKNGEYEKSLIKSNLKYEDKNDLQKALEELEIENEALREKQIELEIEELKGHVEDKEQDISQER